MTPDELKAIAKELEIPEQLMQDVDNLIYEIIDKEAIIKAKRPTRSTQPTKTRPRR